MHIKSFAPDFLKNRVFAGSHPCYHELDFRVFEKLHNLGIKRILTLEKQNSELISQVWKTYGKEYEHVTGDSKTNFFIEDFAAPSIDTLEAIVDSISKAILDGGKPIYIHCRGGLGRTGTVLAAILIKLEGLDSTNAIDFVRSNYSPNAIETTEQEICLKDFEDYLNSKATDNEIAESPNFFTSGRL